MGKKLNYIIIGIIVIAIGVFISFFLFNKSELNTNSQVQIDNADERGTPIAIVGNYLVYYTTGYDEDYVSYIAFYRHNLNDGNNKKLGEILNWTTSLDSFAAFPEGIITFAMEISENNKTINAHYQLDVFGAKLERKFIDEGADPLIDSIAVDDEKYIEFQRFVREDGNINDVVSIGSISEDKVNAIITKERQDQNANSEAISLVNVYEKSVYTFEVHGTDGNFEEFICMYDLEGNLLSKSPVPQALDEFLRNENEFGSEDMLWEIEFFDNYAYFAKLGHSRLILKRDENNNYSKVDSIPDNSFGLVIDSLGYKEDKEECILYSLKSHRFYRFIYDTAELIPLDIYTDGDSYSYVTNGDDLVFQDQVGLHCYKIDK